MAKKTYIARYLNDGLFVGNIDFVTAYSTSGFATFFGSNMSDLSQYIPAYTTTLQMSNYVVPLLSILNTESDKLISIKDIQLNNVGSCDAHATAGIRFMSSLLLNRISSDVTGGATIRLVPVDSNNAAIPSQVTAYKNSNSPGGTLLRKLTVCDNKAMIYTGTIAAQNLPRMTTYGSNSRGSRRNLAAHSFGIGDVTSASPATEIVLNEGEGISLDMINPSLSACVDVFIKVLVISGGDTPPYDTFILSDNVMLYGDSGFSVLSLFNGSGSGVVLKIKEIIFGMLTDFYQGGSSPTNNIYAPSNVPVTMIDGIVSDGTAITPVAMDSINGALPSGIKIQTGGIVSKLGTNKNGYYLRPFIAAGAVMQPTASGVKVSPIDFPGQCKSLRKFGDSVTQKFCLREGDGVAVYCATPTELGRQEVSIIFTIEDIPSSSGGESSYTYMI